jgi:hypothetical protein
MWIVPLFVVAVLLLPALPEAVALLRLVDPGLQVPSISGAALSGVPWLLVGIALLSLWREPAWRKATSG